MTLFQAIVLGAVQGATEFIPVSSTGHLIIVPWLLGWEPNSLAFDLATHVGTLVAVLSYFWRDWVMVYSSLFRYLLNAGKCDEPTRARAVIGIWIVLACIPAALIGFLAGDFVEEKLRNPLFVASTTAGIAVVMLVADRLGRKDRGWAEAKLADWMFVGVAQALALMPGVSRSGITISAGLARGLQREAAARLSFLLSAPIIAGAAALHITEAVEHGMKASEVQAFLVAGITSAVVGYLCIRFLIDYLRRRGLAAFAYYRFGLAALIVALYFFRG